ncbi:FAD-dependent oxidoreductase [Glutamicibacter sp. 2E12]|uniref:FAD-dependent oxidoreductase n=1 Tax=Glutamicibacter sp. 2E12 TaxID=3416181 RepID=UPI003CE75433
MAFKVDDAEYTIPRILQFGFDATTNATSPLTDQQKKNWKEIPVRKDRRTDLLIAGAGLSGCAAAIAAARRGIAVTIVESTHMVGGQATAAGVSAFDVTFFYDRLLHNYGLWGELVRKIQDIYDYELMRPINVGHYRNTSIMPNVVVVERVLSEMLKASGVTVLRNTTIQGVIRAGKRIVGLHTQAGTIMASQTIDATEDGSLLALGGIPHRISNGYSDGIEEKNITSPKRAIQDITYTAVIRMYPEGVPDALRVSEKPAGYDKYVLTFRKVYPKAGVLDKHMQKIGPLGFAGYRAAPDIASKNMQTGSQYQQVTRTCLNYYNDMTSNAYYLTDSDYRERFEASAKMKTISIIYYLQNELGVPWSVATDEGFADGPVLPLNPHLPDCYKNIEQHMPLIPYIRESRRLIGLSTLTGKTISRPRKRSEAAWVTDSVAVGTYHPDLHGGRTNAHLESSLMESEADKPKGWVEGPFPIPVGALIPAQIDGFIAAEKNISCSRIAAGAIRLHPTVVAIGEAGGVLASLAICNKVEPREVPTAAVQAELARGGAIVSQLEVEGATRSSPNFAEINLAVARNRVGWSVFRPENSEPVIETDLDVAMEQGKWTYNYCRKWLDAIKEKLEGRV